MNFRGALAGRSETESEEERGFYLESLCVFQFLKKTSEQQFNFKIPPQTSSFPTKLFINIYFHIFNNDNVYSKTISTLNCKYSPQRLQVFLCRIQKTPVSTYRSEESFLEV